MNNKVTALWTLNKMTNVSEKRLPPHKHSIICSSRCSCHTNRPTSTPAILSVTSTAVDLAEAAAMRSWGCDHMDWPGYFQAEKHGNRPRLHWCVRVCLASRPELRHHEEANSQTNLVSHGKEWEEVMEFVLFGSCSLPGLCPGWSSCALGSCWPVPRDLGRPALLGLSGICPNPWVIWDVTMETIRPPRSWPSQYSFPYY